ncbi:EF-hand domain-containing protein [Phenylobacterium sp.]|jgi:hypothetical protein|uniref:EF-hand domain-containing protein n=1 Tax=Phenylobacterium sp. TaxID=1871053 RepID=UPI00391D17F1
MRTLIRPLVLAALLAGTAGAAAAQMPAPADVVKRWDTDGDGAVSKAEWVAAGRPAERFDIVDRDKDGKITAAELEAAFAAMRQRRGQ